MSENESNPRACDEVLEAWSAALAGGEPVAAGVREHLASCADCRRAAAETERVWTRLGILTEAAPSAMLRRDFDAVLTSYREGMVVRSADGAAAVAGGSTPADASRPSAAARPLAFRRQRTVRRRMYQLGYGLAALLAGVVVGVIWRPDSHREEVAEMRGELRALRQEVALSMLQQTSASARLQGVSVGAEVSRQDPEVLAALLQTLATDESPNVRLAAVDALAGRAGEPAVQQRLGEALRKEASPLVQIALADALLSADGEQARRIVAPLATRVGVRQEVRQYVRQRLGMRT
jgi:HEAT repeat protein